MEKIVVVKTARRVNVKSANVKTVIVNIAKAKKKQKMKLMSQQLTNT